MDRSIMTFEIEPVAKGRPRFSKFGGVYTPAKTKKYEAEIAELARKKWGRPPLENSISITIRFAFKRPKTVKRIHHTVKPDLDNLLKSLIDSMNGIVYKDDSLIVGLQAYKTYSEGDPYIIVEVCNHGKG